MTGAELKAARERLGIRQVDLGEAIGVSREAICRWERRGVPEFQLRDGRLFAILAGPPVNAQWWDRVRRPHQ